MNPAKEQIRLLVLDIVFEREPVEAVTHLQSLVAIVGDKAQARNVPCSKALVREVFWDLFLEKVITLNVGSADLTDPYFLLHSEADERKARKARK